MMGAGPESDVVGWFKPRTNPALSSGPEVPPHAYVFEATAEVKLYESHKDGASVRGKDSSGAEAKRQDDQSDALNQKQHAEHDRHRQRRRYWRADQQYADHDIDRT